MKKLPILLLWLSLHHISGSAQELSPAPWLNGNEKSGPNSGTDLIRTDLYTGTGSVSIPIYNYTVNGINVPITIDNGLNAIQVDEAASNIGLGFEANYGGSIKRQVRGLPDDILQNDVGTPLGAYYLGYFLKGWAGVWYGYKSDELDVFYLNFGSRSVKFMLGKGGQVLTIPQTNLKIERLLNGTVINGRFPLTQTSGQDLSFNITDENGNKFFYRKSYQRTCIDSSNVSSIGTYLTRTYYPIDEWTISKIVTYEGDEINYEYEDINVPHLKYVSQVFRNWGNGGAVLKKEHKPYNLVRIKTIRYPNNVKAEFIYDDQIERCDIPGDKRLTEIKLSEASVTPGVSPRSNSYILKQSYFVSPDFKTVINPSNYFGSPLLVSEVALPTTHCYEFSKNRLRLRLKGIDFKGANGGSKNLYTFDYNPVPLPERIVGGRDQYGYNNGSIPPLHVNGSDSNYLQITRHLVNGTYLGLDQTPGTDKSMTSAWCLKKITNQYNGSISIVYGTNASGNNNYGGVRIDSLILRNGMNAEDNMIKKYDYQNLEGYGQEGPQHYHFAVYSFNNCANPGGGDQYEIYSNSCVVINQGLNRSNYGYRNIDEYLYNGSGEMTQKTSHELTSLLNNKLPINSKDLGVAPYASKQYIREWGVGLPLNVKVYDNNGRIKSATSNTYIVRDEMRYQNDSEFWCHPTLPSSQACYAAIMSWYSDDYFPFTGTARIEKTTTRYFTTDVDFSEEEELFVYDSLMNPTVHRTTNSKGEYEYDYKFYSYNWKKPSFNGGINPGPCIQKLNNDQVDKEIYGVTTRSINNQEKVINISANGIVQCSGNYVRDKYFYKFKPKALSDFQNLNLDYGSLSAGIESPQFKKTSEITKFDDKGYAIEILDQLSGKRSAFVYETETGNKLAEAANAAYDEIAYCGFESNYYSNGPEYSKGNVAFNPNGVSTQFALFGRYSFNVSSATNRGLYTTGNLSIGMRYKVSYWMYQGSSIGVNDGTNPINPQFIRSYQGWNLYQAEFTATASNIGIWGDGYVDEVRLSPVNSIIANYNYLPFAGLSSETDANLRFKLYEYDEFGNKTISRDQNGNITSKSKFVIQGIDQ